MDQSQHQSLRALTHLTPSQQRDWNSAQWKSTIEAARVGLTRTLKDLKPHLASGIDPALKSSVTTYLMQQVDTEETSSVRSKLWDLIHCGCFNLVLLPLTDMFLALLRILDAQWNYEKEISRSFAECCRRESLHSRRPDSVHVFFYYDLSGDTLAYIDYDQQSVSFNIRYSMSKHPSTDTLTDLVPVLKPGDVLDDLYNTLTPTLLHECLHLAHDKIRDVRIYKSDFADWIESNINTKFDEQGNLDCYDEYECRMLTRLAYKQFPFARPSTGIDKPYLPSQITFSSSENITRALLSIWLSQERDDLNFFSREDLLCPTITATRSRVA